MYHDYMVVHFFFPHCYGNYMDTVAVFEPGCLWEEYRDINIEEFLFRMEDEHGFELVSAIPVKIDLLGESKIDFFFRSMEGYEDEPEPEEN